MYDAYWLSHCADRLIERAKLYLKQTRVNCSNNCCAKYNSGNQSWKIVRHFFYTKAWDILKGHYLHPAFDQKTIWIPASGGVPLTTSCKWWSVPLTISRKWWSVPLTILLLLITLTWNKAVFLSMHTWSKWMGGCNTS